MKIIKIEVLDFFNYFLDFSTGILYYMYEIYNTKAVAGKSIRKLSVIP